MKNLYISGYRSYELQIFSDDDIKLKYLKAFLETELKRLLEEGWEWFIITGELGIEQWVGEIILKLKKDYEQAKLAILFPYTDFGGRWNETNQSKLLRLKERADYVNYTSQQPYFSPKQLQANQRFVLQNTDGLLLFYDELFPGKPKYLKEAVENAVFTKNFNLMSVSMDELDLFVGDHPDLFHEEDTPTDTL